MLCEQLSQEQMGFYLWTLWPFPLMGRWVKGSPEKEIMAQVCFCCNKTDRVSCSSFPSKSPTAHISLIPSLADFCLLTHTLSDCQVLLSAALASKATMPLPPLVFRCLTGLVANTDVTFTVMDESAVLCCAVQALWTTRKWINSTRTLPAFLQN